MVDDRNEGVGSEGWLAVESGDGTGVCSEVEEVEEEYAAARKSRPIFQRGTIARLSDRATTWNILSPGENFWAPAATETCWRNVYRTTGQARGELEAVESSRIEKCRDLPDSRLTRSTSRMQDALRCPCGHTRDFFVFRVSEVE